MYTEAVHLARQEKMNKRLAHQKKQAVNDTQIRDKNIQEAGVGAPPESTHRIDTLGRGRCLLCCQGAWVY